MGLCKYRDALGKPGKGIHFHVLGIAIMDLLMTIGVVLLLAWWQKWNWKVTLFAFVVVMVITILVHRLFCVNTTINKMIFGYIPIMVNQNVFNLH